MSVLTEVFWDAVWRLLHHAERHGEVYPGATEDHAAVRQGMEATMATASATSSAASESEVSGASATSSATSSAVSSSETLPEGHESAAAG